MIDGHGDDSYKYSRPITANFSSNVYSKVNLSRLKAHLCECIGEIGNYPEPEPYTLEARIASRCQLPSGAVCVTNGATEAIYLIAQTFRGTNTAILQPTFSEYADACRMHGHRVSSLYQLPKEQDGYRLPDDVRMLWLCNPNNPTGTGIAPELLERILCLAAEKHIFVLLDECFCDMAETEPGIRSMLPCLEQYPHVLVLKSLTKLYAIPGLRLGYGLCADTELVEKIRQTGQPWPVNTLAEEAGIAALHAEEYREKSLSFLRDERWRLYDELGKLGFRVWKPSANFVFFRAEGCPDLDERLIPYGILLRHCDNYVGLGVDDYRAAVRLPEENAYLLRCLRQVMEEVLLWWQNR